MSSIYFPTVIFAAVVTVMFGAPTYTFNETGVVGTIEVVKMGATSEDFSVRVFGGMNCLGLCRLLTSKVLCISMWYLTGV